LPVRIEEKIILVKSLAWFKPHYPTRSRVIKSKSVSIRHRPLRLIGHKVQAKKIDPFDRGMDVEG
jgi:hypothetical protein